MDTGIVIIIALLALGTVLVFALFRRSGGSDSAMLTAKLGEISAAQNAIQGRLTALDSRLDENMKGSATVLGGLQQRLSVIDEAQKKIADLSGQMVSLKDILSDKQSRGAYGQGNMEAIVRDALPAGIYEFQATLSNRSRPDCLIRLPNTAAAIVIDSKFPLESFSALKAAADGATRREAMAQVKSDVMKHVKDIADKYLLPGETQDPAIMFVPSESIYAELHDNFPDIIQQAHRARVVVVSPNLLLLAVNTVRTVLKDARMREQANRIQQEVGLLLKDAVRLGERVENLRRHFVQAEGDLKEIAVSAEKVVKRAGAIEQVELPHEEKPATPQIGEAGRAVN
ncbi:MAG: DNA recombination protein RmuC [Alphaproteobacteria bacterium]